MVQKPILSEVYELLKNEQLVSSESELAETGWEEASVICAHYASKGQNQVLDVLRYVQASCSTMDND